MAKRHGGSVDHEAAREAHIAAVVVVLEERHDEFGNTAGGR